MKACRPDWWQITPRDEDGQSYIPWDLYHRDFTRHETMSDDVNRDAWDHLVIEVRAGLSSVKEHIKEVLRETR